MCVHIVGHGIDGRHPACGAEVCSIYSCGLCSTLASTLDAIALLLQNEKCGHRICDKSQRVTTACIFVQPATG